LVSVFFYFKKWEKFSPAEPSIPRRKTQVVLFKQAMDGMEPSIEIEASASGLKLDEREKSL
jgi:hypothetical protein